MSCISGVLCLGAIALSGCQSKTHGAAASPAGAPPAEASASDSYPLLQTVPPRPQLSYTVEQQREIVEALIADRENARYTDQVVRYRSGLSSLPPPPAPAAPVAAPVAKDAASEAAREPGEASGVARPEVGEQGAAASTQPDALEEDTFVGFLRALSRQFQSDDPEPTPGDATPERSAPDDVSDAPTAPQDDTAQTAVASPQPVQVTAIEEMPDEARAPLPPTQTAVAARQAADPAPLPPAQTAVAARQAAADRLGADAAHRAPIPAPHPERAALAGRPGPGPASVPQPPPSKPPPPADGQSAAAQAPDGVAVTRALSIADNAVS